VIVTPVINVDGARGADGNLFYAASLFTRAVVLHGVV